jgi:hypothetical protein
MKIEYDLCKFIAKRLWELRARSKHFKFAKPICRVSLASFQVDLAPMILMIFGSPMSAMNYF